VAPSYRAAFALIVAVLVVQSGVTVGWNTRSVAPARPEVAGSAVQTATVVHVTGTHVLLRMNDGTTRVFIATPQQAHELEHLVGAAVRFRLTGPRNE
jgi:hypothetical protein